MIIKVCGMRTGENIREVEQLGIDMMGFIFFPPSARNVSVVPDYLPAAELRTGVFVNERADRILTTANLFGLTRVQLHGEESPELCRILREFGLEVIKAFPLRSESDLRLVAQYTDCCDYALFDTPTPAKGGSGKKFDWQILKQYNGKLPFLLSGGIGPEDFGALREFTHPALAGYDLNSRFEIRPGLKEVGLLRDFIAQINKKHR